jgi:hypothetical protein
MNKVLIYKSNDDLLVTYFPHEISDPLVREHADEILKFGTCFRIADVSEIPTDRTFRSAWEIEDADLNDGVSGEFGPKQKLLMLNKTKSYNESKLKESKDQLSNLPKIIEEKEQLNDESLSQEIIDLKKELEDLPQAISDLESSIEDIEVKISEQESIINELLEILPLEKRRQND